MAKKKSTAAEKDLRAQVGKLQKRLDRATKSADRWKAKARKAQASSAKAEKRVVKLTKRLDRPSSSDAQPTRSAGPTPAVQPRPLAAVPSGPDETWTLAALKDEARTRKVTGFSRMSKADLLAALR